jgi:hypothetical protein
MSTSPAIPLVNAAGTAGKKLEDQARAVRNLARELLDALNQAAPKECDYHGHPRADEWDRAVQEHTLRCRWVNGLRNDFDAILQDIEVQAAQQGQTQAQARAQQAGNRNALPSSRRG